MSKTLIEMAHEMVIAQMSAKPMTTEEIKNAFLEIHQMLKSMDENLVGSAQTDDDRPNLEPSKSIKRKSVICLECGGEFKMLSSKHLASHGLDAKSYRQKYGFPSRQALCARYLSERRIESGKARGLPAKLREYLDRRGKKKGNVDPADGKEVVKSPALAEKTADMSQVKAETQKTTVKQTKAEAKAKPQE